MKYSYLIVAMLALVAMLACGPADESVQQQLGNLPPAQQEDPAPAPTPTPTPTPTPQPTACVTFEDDQGNTTDRCFTEPTPYPDAYEKFDTRVIDAVIESEKRPEFYSSEDEETLRVEIRFRGAENGVAIAKWLTDRDITNDLWLEGDLVYASVPPSSMVALSELEGVITIWTPENLGTTDGPSLAPKDGK